MWVRRRIDDEEEVLANCHSFVIRKHDRLDKYVLYSNHIEWLFFDTFEQAVEKLNEIETYIKNNIQSVYEMR